jgi:hypothetical protein
MTRDMTTWRKALEEALANRGESFDDVEANTMTEEEMDKEFDPDYTSPEITAPFTVWTKNSVYFPTSSDGYDVWISVVSRNPDGKPTKWYGED